MSLSPDHTRWMSPPPLYNAHTTPSFSSTDLKPYLELRHLLSLTWLAYPILSLLFVVFRLQLSLSSSQDALANAKSDIIASCKAAERAATAAASMPRYMAAATNRQFADAINDTMNGAREGLVLSLTIMEGVINFIVDIYRSTLLCFVELVVQGGLALLISAVQELNTFVQNAASSIRTSIQNDIATANSGIQSAVSGINKINPFGNINIPQFSIPSLSALDNITLPTDFENALISLNNSLPTFTELKQTINNLLDTPFESLKADINNTFASISFNSSILPLPEENTLTFCNQVDTSVVDDLGRDLVKAAEIGTVILILIALLLIAGNCALEWYKWRCLKRHLARTRQAWVSDPTLYHTGSSKAPEVTLSDHNLMVLRGISLHPLLTLIAYKLESWLRLSPSQHAKLQWFFHYVFHPPALACFLLGFFGLLSVQIQLMAIGPLEAKFNQQASASATDLSNLIVTSVNASMFNQSSLYANGINSQVDTIQSTINNGLFGWVNGTTTTLNNTLNEFYNDVQNVVATLFNGTVLENPAQDFLRCILGSKVDAFEEALTFLNQNLQVNMPRVNESILVLSPEQVNEATQPIAQAAIGNGQGTNEGVVGRAIASYAKSLEKERVMFGIFMVLWLVVVLMAIAILLWHSYVRHWIHQYRKHKWEKKRKADISEIIVPFRGRNPGSDEKEGRVLNIDLPSFTPLPSPLPAFPLGDRFTTVESAKPGYSRSSDSFFDHDEPEIGEKLRISSPRKLVAGGRGTERFVPDGGNVHLEKGVLNHPLREKVSWMGRLTAMVRGTTSNDAQSEPRTAVDSTYGVDRQNEAPSQRSMSVWSSSTLAASAPWTSQSKKRSIPPLPPLARNFKPVDIPTDVSSDYEGTAIPSQKPSSTSIAVTLRHDTPSQLSLMSPTQHANRNGDSYANPQGEVTTPLTKLMNRMHARQSSSLNPFATPFDDENRAPVERFHPSNPYAAVAF